MSTYAGIVRSSHMGGRKVGADNFHADRDQVDTVEDYARPRGITVEFMPPEMNVSGGRAIEDRPSLRAAIEGVEAGLYDGIIVAYLSRLTRSRSGIQIWDRVEAAGGHVHSAQENLDTSTPSGRFVRDIHLANAVREREEHVDRFENKREWATAAGIWQRRQTPRGYDRDPETRKLVPSTQAHEIQETFTRRAAGEPVSSLARYLGMTTNGARFLLRNRVYLGELKVGQHLNLTAHPPLVSASVFEEAQRITARPPRSKRNAGPALLAGIVRCEGCGHVMPRTGSISKGTQYSYYVCAKHHSGATCPNPAGIAAHKLDGHLEAIIKAELRRFEVSADEGEGTEEARQEVESARTELDAYLQAVSVADVGAEAFAAGARKRREVLQAAETELRGRIARAPAHGIGSSEEAWEALTAEQRNSTARGVLATVVVRKVGRGNQTPVQDRTRVLAATFPVILPANLGSGALGLHALPFPDRDVPGVLREPGLEREAEGACG